MWHLFFIILTAASRCSATAQVGVAGLGRFTVGVLESARSVTKRMSEQCLCKKEGKLERQNIPAELLVGFAICAKCLRNRYKIESETATDLGNKPKMLQTDAKIS